MTKLDQYREVLNNPNTPEGDAKLANWTRLELPYIINYIVLLEEENERIHTYYKGIKE